MPDTVMLPVSEGRSVERPTFREIARPRPFGRGALLALAFAAIGVSAAAQPTASPEEPQFRLPGGAAALARTLDIRADLPPARVLVTAVRMLWEAPDGVAPASDRRRRQVSQYLRGLESGAQAAAGASADTVPAFLPHAAWATVYGFAGVARETPLCRAIVEKRAVALIYYGAASLDAPTRAYLAAHPRLLRWLSNEPNAALFAAFGRALHVRGAAIDVPGGPDAVPLWEALAGDSPIRNPEAFLPRVLTIGAGRLALLYDGIGHMDEGARRFALGLQLAPNEREARFRALYNACGAALAQWHPEIRPFERVPFDAVHLLLATKVGAGGDLRGPPWLRLWKAAFDASFDPAASRLSARDLEQDGPLDAASLVELVGAAGESERRLRAETWLLANRVFHGVPASAAVDIVVALQGYARYPTLLLTLDRMGISDPATYAAAVRTAGLLSNADRRLWQFQAALAVVERARFARSFDRTVADRLVRRLCELAATDGADRALARWLTQDLLGAGPATVLPASVVPGDRPLETRLLALIAGSVASGGNRALLAHPLFEWEGLKYRVDPAGAMLVRLVAVRAKQGGASLDDDLAVVNEVEALARAGSAREAQAAVQRLGGAAGPLLPLRPDVRPAPFGESAPRLDQLVEGAVEWARKLTANPDKQAIGRITQPLAAAAHHHLALLLGSIAYASYIADPGASILLSGDPSRVHHFRFFKPGTELGRHTAWELPIEWRDNEVGTRISGSLLGLDSVLGRYALKRMAGETMPEAPNLSDGVRQAFTEAACLSNPFDLTEDAREALLAAVERGRQRVTALTAGSAELDAVANELDEWRSQELRWIVARQAGDDGTDPKPGAANGRLAIFSLGDLARLGGLSSSGVAGLDAYGTSGFSLDQGFRSIYPDRLPWSTMLGRRGVRSVPALVPDLTFGVAAMSARLHLPAALIPGLLAVATQQFFDTLHMPYEDDWPAMVANAQAVAGSRVEDLVAALTVSGPLVPDER